MMTVNGPAWRGRAQKIVAIPTWQGLGERS